MLRVKELVLLNGKKIDLELLKGEILEIEGANGSGKSLFLKSLARLTHSSWKELSLHEKTTHEYSLQDWRGKILYLPPEVSFDPEMSVKDFFDLPLGFERYLHFKKSFHPENHWSELTVKMSSLSSGQRQQVALLRALSLSPKILLLDEPFGHMDSLKRKEFVHLLDQWCHEGERGIILVSHIPVLFNSLKLNKTSFS
jgi:ABC-type multidrug transport system ATPase subunit